MDVLLRRLPNEHSSPVPSKRPYAATIDESSLRQQTPGSVVGESKLFRYRGDENIVSLVGEFTNLRDRGVTHVRMIPGQMSEILYYARMFDIVVADDRMVREMIEFQHGGRRKSSSRKKTVAGTRDEKGSELR